MIAARKTEFNVKMREVLINANGAMLEGTLALPHGAKALVLFAHGSGSSRHSSRNRYVAQVLQSTEIGTLLFDLLTNNEEPIDRYTGELRFDIPFLARRLVGATNWVRSTADTKDLRLGYFGASTGAAAALVAAAELPDAISAVVSRGGRPDLAMGALDFVCAPTLLIVGENDKPVISMNREAWAELKCEKKLVIIPGATHLFEEPGTLEQVAEMAAKWFTAHLNSTELRAQKALAHGS